MLCIRKIHPGKAGISVGLGGLRVAFDYMIRIPVVQNFEEMDISVKKLEIHRKGKDGLVCKRQHPRRHHRGLLHPRRSH
jgi:hypothetical protein